MKSNLVLFNYLRPTVFIKNIMDVNLFSLRRSGVKYIFCDLDNTLIPHFTSLPNATCTKFANDVKNNDIKLIIISNNKKYRVETFCNLINVDDFIYNAKKPLVGKIKKIMEKYNISPEDVIFIGDQFITDIFVANRLSIKSILVLPLVESSKTGIKNFIIFLLERFIYRHISLSYKLNVDIEGDLKVGYDII